MITIYDINGKSKDVRYSIDAKECLESGYYFATEEAAAAALAAIPAAEEAAAKKGK